jgi:hypothetical protein
MLKFVCPKHGEQLAKFAGYSKYSWLTFEIIFECGCSWQCWDGEFKHELSSLPVAVALPGQADC